MMQAALLLLASVATASAADLSGVWTGVFPTRLGERDIAFKLTQSGNSITGKMYGDYGSTPIMDGKAAGNLITFVLVVSEQSGNQINDTRIRYTGRLENGVLELIQDREGATIAGNGGSVFIRNNVKTVMRLKRLM